MKFTMATNGSSPRRRESVLDAASALASLGGTPGPSCDMERIQDTFVEKNGTPVGDTAQTLSTPSSDLSLRGDLPLTSTFPETLMDILSNDEVSDIITWLPHGRGFAILQKRKFALHVMPHYFKQSKFTSFTRKLNRWGFTRVTKGHENGAYYHMFFQRDNHQMCMQMQCQSTPSFKGNSPVISPKASPKRSQDMKSAKSPDINAHDTGKSQDHENFVGFGEVLHRQRQLLRESQQASSHGDLTTSNRKTPGSNRVLDREQSLRISDTVVCGPCQSQELQQARLEFDPAVRVQSLIRQRTSSSRRCHRLIIQSALNALKSRSDHEYLPTPASTEKEDASARGSAIFSSSLHSSMQDRLRQLEEHNTRMENALKNDSYARLTRSSVDVAQLQKKNGERRCAFQRHN